MTLEKLSIPIPKGGAGLGTLDFRGANVGLKVKVSGMTGEVALPETDAAATQWKAFTVEPVELAVNIDDLSKPVKIATGTCATLDGKPAGDIQIGLEAEGLLDAAGHLSRCRRTRDSRTGRMCARR